MEAKPQIEIRGRYRVGDIRHALADVSLLETSIGYRPATSFESGVRAFAEWAEKNAADADDIGAQRELAPRDLFRQAHSPQNSIG